MCFNWFTRTKNDASKITGKEAEDLLRKEFGSQCKIYISDEYYLKDTKKSLIDFLKDDDTDRFLFESEIADCIYYNTPIVCRKNGVISIKEIQELDNSYEILDHSEDWTKVNWIKSKRTNKQILSKVDKGVIILTEDHMVKKYDDYINFSNCDYPDTINIGNKFSIHDNISKDIAWVYGLFFSDGHCKHYLPNKTQNHKYSWKISNVNIDYLKKAKSILNEGFVIKSYPSEMVGIVRGGVIARHTLYNLIHSNGYGKTRSIVTEWQDMFYSESYNKKVPDCILNGSKEIAQSFLDGVYAGDGSKLTTNKIITVGSYIGLLGLQVLLEKLGKTYYVKSEPRRKNTWYIIYDNMYKFYQKQSLSVKVDNDIVYDINTYSGNLIAGNCKIKNCDDFSFRLMGNAAFGKLKGTAFGILWTKTSTGGAHAINCFIDDNHIVWLIEPQNDRIYLLPDDWEPMLVVM